MSYNSKIQFAFAPLHQSSLENIKHFLQNYLQYTRCDTSELTQLFQEPFLVHLIKSFKCYKNINKSKSLALR